MTTRPALRPMSKAHWRNLLTYTEWQAKGLTIGTTSLDDTNPFAGYTSTRSRVTSPSHATCTSDRQSGNPTDRRPGCRAR